MKNRSTEDYIKGIFSLHESGGSVTTSLLAKHLKIGDGSVTDMVKKLSEKGLIEYEPYKGVKLTGEGRRLALKMIRRHRLWEMFLVRFLDYSWDEIHGEAELLEHVTSDDLERRIDHALGYPKVDPHGSPIPDADGELHEVECRTLSCCHVDDTGIIVQVKDESPEMLKLMTRLGLVLNTQIAVKEVIGVDGTVVIAIVGSDTEIPLSPVFAQSIFIRTV